ncbi:hypothetical protein KX467_17760 [Escherichia coli]|nr:hypothetical protein [Escherichia coli]
MKKIIVFFNSEPAMVVPVMTGDHKVIYVAADRHVTSEEILEAAMRLLN